MLRRIGSTFEVLGGRKEGEAKDGTCAAARQARAREAKKKEQRSGATRNLDEDRTQSNKDRELGYRRMGHGQG